MNENQTKVWDLVIIHMVERTKKERLKFRSRTWMLQMRVCSQKRMSHCAHFCPLDHRYSPQIGEAACLSEIQTDDIQLEFKILQDVYSKVRTATDLKFNGTRSRGKTNKEAIGIICNSAKYTEVALKILTFIHRKSADPNFQVNRQLQELYLGMYAQMRYLQEDYSTLMCEADFGAKTKRFYRSLLKNTSSYPVSSLPKLELAGRMAAIPTEEAPRHGGYSGWSGGPRGGFRNVRMRGRGFGRGTCHEQSSAFAPRSVPFDRQSS